MTRYAAMFDRCARCQEAALGAFLMLGDPDPESCHAHLDALVAGGADMIEVGIPFSDPVADGPVIQAAALRALQSGFGTRDAIAMIAAFRERHPEVPLGVLTYANIVAASGIERFTHDLAEAGADSLLVADVPQLEALPYAGSAARAGLDLVLVAASNTPDEALDRIASLASGYTYCVARPGVTGEGRATTGGHAELFTRLASFGAPPPVLGFGLSTAAHVERAVADGAAGVIVGSAIVDRLARGEPIPPFLAELKAATRRRCLQEGPAHEAPTLPWEIGSPLSSSR